MDVSLNMNAMLSYLFFFLNCSLAVDRSELSNDLSSKLGLGQNIAMLALCTARNRSLRKSVFPNL